MFCRFIVCVWVKSFMSLSFTWMLWPAVRVLYLCWPSGFTCSRNTDYQLQPQRAVTSTFSNTHTHTTNYPLSSSKEMSEERNICLIFWHGSFFQNLSVLLNKDIFIQSFGGGGGILVAGQVRMLLRRVWVQEEEKNSNFIRFSVS